MTYQGSLTITQITPIEAFQYSLTGFTVVMTTLAALWLITLGIAQIIKVVGLDKVSEQNNPTQDATIPPETVAVITAAVSFSTNGKGKISDIRRLN